MESLLQHDDPHVRGWSIQLLGEASPVNAFQVVEKTEEPVLQPSMLKQLAVMSAEDPSPVVRLYLAALAQRLPFADRWPILEGLAGHAEDVEDNNLPRMVWFGLEPMVPKHSQRALRLAVGGKFPNLSEFVARRMISGDEVSSYDGPKQQSAAEQNDLLQNVARGL